MLTHTTYNELSHDNEFAKSEHQAVELLERMIETLRLLLQIGFKQLKVSDTFLQDQILPGLTFEKAISKLDRDARQIWYKALSSPYTSVDDDAIVLKTIKKIDGIECNYPEGIAYAFVDGTIAVSFDRSHWQRDYLGIDVFDEVTQRDSSHRIPHVSNSEHVPSHIVFASRVTSSIVLQLSPRISNPLPNVLMSNLLVDPSWDVFQTEISSLSVQQKTARLKQTAERVAIVNGYQYCVELSAINQQKSGALRQIFQTEFLCGRETIYLSTDFENSAGAFEVCDHRGKHHGEWLFCGRMNKSRSDSHDIHLSRV